MHLLGQPQGERRAQEQIAGCNFPDLPPPYFRQQRGEILFGVCQAGYQRVQPGLGRYPNPGQAFYVPEPRCWRSGSRLKGLPETFVQRGDANLGIYPSRCLGEEGEEPFLQCPLREECHLDTPLQQDGHRLVCNVLDVRRWLERVAGGTEIDTPGAPTLAT